MLESIEGGKDKRALYLSNFGELSEELAITVNEIIEELEIQPKKHRNYSDSIIITVVEIKGEKVIAITIGNSGEERLNWIEKKP